MIRRFLALAACLWLAACSAPAGHEREWPTPSPALWELKDAQGQQGWLFGTVHALPEGLEWRNQAADAALEQSGLLVVEIADLANSQEAAAAFRARASTPGLPPLLQRLPPDDRAAVGHLLAMAGMDERDFADMELWAAALTLAGATRKYDPANGVDRALLSEAEEAVGLETFALQFSYFDQLAQEDQAQLLVAVAEEVRRAEQDEHVSAWLTGDLAALERSAMQGMLADPELQAALVTARNGAWAGTIARLMEQGRRPFVAVGAAHMLGNDGLPALLAARGFEVRRIQ